MSEQKSNNYEISRLYYIIGISQSKEAAYFSHWVLFLNQRRAIKEDKMIIYYNIGILNKCLSIEQNGIFVE